MLDFVLKNLLWQVFYCLQKIGSDLVTNKNKSQLDFCSHIDIRSQFISYTNQNFVFCKFMLSYAKVQKGESPNLPDIVGT